MKNLPYFGVSASCRTISIRIDYENNSEATVFGFEGCEVEHVQVDGGPTAHYGIITDGYLQDPETLQVIPKETPVW